MSTKLSVCVIAIIAFTLSATAQSKIELEAKEFFWGATDKYKDANTIPDKWSNESAVIIYKNENYDFHKFGKKITYKTSIRKRIKLLDNSSLKEFSEFSFTKRFRSNKGRYSWRKKGDNVVGVKVIKPDGKEIIIDVNADAIEVDGETKLAISNLEVGDIIDYYFYKVEPFKSELPFSFDAVEATLAEEYPILDFKLFFESENDFFINFKSFNGAPEIKKIASKKNNQRRYSLEASDIDKRDSPRWFYPLVELPTYKFQVNFARTIISVRRALAFIPEKEDIIKTSVSSEEILDLYDRRFESNGDIGDLKDFFKKKVFKTDTEKVTAAYYYMRHYYLTRYVEAIYASEADITSPFYLYGSNPVFIQNERQFVKHVTEFLKRQKIPYEIVIAKKRYDGSIDDLLIEKNVNVLLKVLTETPIYLEFFGPHTSINQFTPYVEGSDVYLLSATKGKIDGIKRGKLPVSSHLDNETKKDISVTINSDFSALDFSIKNNFKGHHKADEQKSRLIFNSYVKEDYSKYGTKSLTEMIKNKKSKIKVNKEMKALIEKIQTKQKEEFEKTARNEFELTDIKDYSYEITDSGRFGFDTYFTYKENYTAEGDFLKKAGPNYIFEIGKLISGQIEIKDEERDRTENIYMNYPRSYNYNITLNIPEGYTVAGLDKLNKSVVNSTGGFESVAKIEDNKLIINTSKYYKHIMLPNSEWPNMMAFLDEAYQFTKEKILIKKN